MPVDEQLVEGTWRAPWLSFEVVRQN